MRRLLFYFLFLVFCSIGCSNPVKQENLTANDFVIDTVVEMHNAFFLTKMGQDSLVTVKKPVMVIKVPARSKRVKWYSLNYSIDGTGILDLITEDDGRYNNVRLPSTSVAACSILLQNSYVRFDTISHELTAYKYEPSESEQTIYKAF